MTLDEARRRLVEGDSRVFAALTFDDGYRDTLEVALPILEARSVPFTVYCSPGFVERRARLWWLELEEAIRRMDTIELGPLRYDARTEASKQAAFERIYWRLRAQPESELLGAIGDLARHAGYGAIGYTRASSSTQTRSPDSRAIRRSRRSARMAFSTVG